MGQDRYTREFNPPFRNDPFRGAPVWQPLDTNCEDNRYQESQDPRRPPISIEKALREYCNIPGRHFFVASIDDDGTTNTFTSASCKLPEGTIKKFFDKETFRRSIPPTSSVTTPMFEDELPFDNDAFQYPADLMRRWGPERRYGPGPESYDDDVNPKMRKRLRSSLVRHEEPIEEEGPSPIISSKKAIRIDNEKEIWDFYEQRFKNCQQTACKLIAKAWIKLVEPKKQSTHPYTGKDEKAPDWWPQPWGDTKEERVRHKEPDHLYKRERVYLLNHILRMIVDPKEVQHKDIRKLNLDVSKLEECTYEALSTFFADKENPSQARKKPYLKEIFKVARQEQRFKAGEIDPSTKVHVIADDRIPENWTSDNDGVDSLKDDDEQDLTPVSSAISPQKGTTPNALIPPQHSTDHSPTGHMPGVPYLTDMPVRGAQYSQQIMGSELPPEQAHYIENASITGQTPIHAAGVTPMHHDMYPPPQDTSRRNSMFTAPSEYTSPATPTIYQGGWQSSTAAPANSAMYSFTPTQPAAHPPFVNQHSVPMAHSQQYMNSSFDGLSRGGHDSNPTNMFRSGSLGHTSAHQQPGYSGYMPQDNRSLQASTIKMETARNPLV